MRLPQAPSQPSQSDNGQVRTQEDLAYLLHRALFVDNFVILPEIQRK
jgi:hypothetical protein